MDDSVAQDVEFPPHGHIKNRDDVNSHLVLSSDPAAPANRIPELCALFYKLGWVPGTGGGASIRDGYSCHLGLDTRSADDIKRSSLLGTVGC